MIAQHLRTKNKKIYLVANKIDGMDPDVALAPFYELGLGEIFATTATHGRGVTSMMGQVLADVPETEAPAEPVARGIIMEEVRRPNVGTTNMVHRLLGVALVV